MCADIQETKDTIEELEKIMVFHNVFHSSASCLKKSMDGNKGEEPSLLSR